MVPDICLGLVNGYQGIIKKIWYWPQDDPKSHKLPAAIFVECPRYSGTYDSLYIKNITSQIYQVLKHQAGIVLIHHGFLFLQWLLNWRINLETNFLMNSFH